MPDTAAASAPSSFRPLLIIGGVFILLIAGTVALWAHYGTTVFYEMILAGIAACF